MILRNVSFVNFESGHINTTALAEVKELTHSLFIKYVHQMKTFFLKGQLNFVQILENFCDVDEFNPFKPGDAYIHSELGHHIHIVSLY